MESILGRQGAMIFWAIVALVCLASVVLRLTGVTRRDGDGGALRDHAWEGMQQVSAQMSPRWMQGRFGTIVYIVFGVVFFTIAFGAVAVRLVQGPAQTAENAPANSHIDSNSTGAF